MRSDEVLAGVPASVAQVQEALAARSRLVIVKQLLQGPLTFAELSERVPLSVAGVRAGLSDLAELGYVSDDSPPGRQRKATSARFRVDRDRLLRDVMGLVLYLVE